MRKTRDSGITANVIVPFLIWVMKDVMLICLRRFPYMLGSRETHFKQKNMTDIACFHGQHFLCLLKIPLVLLAFAITFKGINTLRC